MSDLRTEAPAPSAPPPPPRPQPGEYTVTDERSAGRAIAALVLDDKLKLPDPAARRPEPQEPEPRDPGTREQPSRAQDDAAATPSVPTTTENDADASEPAEPAIQAPSSWSADAKEIFASLPPDLQKTVADRESQREAFVQQRAQEASETRRAADAARLEAAAQSAAYLDGLQRARLTVLPEVAQLAQVDWMRLRVENPDEYTRLINAREMLGQRLQWVDNAIAQEQQNVAAQNQQAFFQRQEEERQHLHRKVPDFQDPVRREAIRGDLVNYLKGKGYSDQELSLAIDHRSLDIAYDALRWHQQENARKGAEEKRNNPAPQLQRPGSPATRENGAQTQFRQAAQQLGRTNSVRDAGRLLALSILK